MVRVRVGFPVLILPLLMAHSVIAQDTRGFPLSMAGQGKRCYFGECEDGAPPQATAPAAAPTRPTPPPAPTPPPQAAAPPRLAPAPSPTYQNALNFANELTNFGVPPQNVLQPRLGSRTPTSIPGGRVVTTLQVRYALQSGLRFLMIDAWDDAQHQIIPGAVHIPYAGRPGTFQDDVQRSFYQELGRLTRFNPGYPIVFYCAGSECWESYNATLRAEAMGFSNVFWYRGGMAAWNQSTTGYGLR